MARFQSHQGVRSHKIEDVIGDLEVHDDVLDLLFFVEMDTKIRTSTLCGYLVQRRDLVQG